MRFVITLFTMLVTLPVRADTVSICADHWYPFNGDPSSDRPGYMIEIARHAFATTGHTMDYRIGQWDRAVEDAVAGRIDCIVGASEDESEGLLLTEQPLGMDVDVVITPAESSWQYVGPQSLRSLRFAVMPGYEYGEDLDAYIASKPTNLFLMRGHDGLGRAIKMMDAGRLDAYIDSRTVFLSRVQADRRAGDFRIGGEVDEKFPLYIACSAAKPSSRMHIKALDRAIVSLRASGELARILGRYGLDDWESRNR